MLIIEVIIVYDIVFCPTTQHVLSLVQFLYYYFKTLCTFIRSFVVNFKRLKKGFVNNMHGVFIISLELIVASIEETYYTVCVYFYSPKFFNKFNIFYEMLLEFF